MKPIALLGEFDPAFKPHVATNAAIEQLRCIVLTETRIGLDPEQTVYTDYREVAGVKLPFTITVSYLDDGHLGTARKYLEVRQNAPVDEALFNPPK